MVINNDSKFSLFRKINIYLLRLIGIIQNNKYLPGWRELEVRPERVRVVPVQGGVGRQVGDSHHRADLRYGLPAREFCLVFIFTIRNIFFNKNGM